MTTPIGVDLFAGAGGLSLGFTLAGFKVVGAVDANSISAETHKRNFPSCKTITKDITLLSGEEIRRVCKIGEKTIDVVFGGPPCQGFSVGGIRKPGDRRNALVMEFARLVVELRPRHFVMENVAGLLEARNKKLLSRFRALLLRAGYSIVEPIKVLNAVDFGVPQTRRRVFIIGSASGETPLKYPRRRSKKPTVSDALSDLIGVDGSARTGTVFRGTLRKPSWYAASLRTRAKEITGFAVTAHTEAVVARFKRTSQGEREPISRFLRLKMDGVSCTLRAGTGPENGSFMAARPIHPIFDRCIYPREAARIHSFPDWFSFDDRLWHAFREIGNSVPPFLGRAVANSVMRALKN